MKLQTDNLGKVSITIDENPWNPSKDYDKLVIVEREGTSTTYISRKPVPAGTSISNRKYWIKFSKWSDIPYEVVQELGDSPEVVVSQKIITMKINELQGLIDNINDIIGEGGSIDERIATAKLELIDGASEEGDTFKKIEDRLSDVEKSVGEGGSVDERIAVETNRAQAAEELLREAYESLSQSQAIPKTDEEWAAMTSWEEGVIYRVAGTTSYTDYMYNGTTTIPMATYNNAIDDKPTAGSDNLVKSGGVYSSTPTIANSIEESDLDVSDEQGNVLIRCANGHIQVKNFSSDKNNANIGINSIEAFNEDTNYSIDDIVKYDGLLYKFIVAHTAGEWNIEEVEQTNLLEVNNHPVNVITRTGEPDLDFSDEQGNVLMRLYNGHIKTKNFDSSDIDIIADVESHIMQIHVASPLLTVNGNDIIGLTQNKNEVACTIDVFCKDYNFKDNGTIAYQGNTSLKNPAIIKKGFTLNFDNKHRFEDWIEMDSFHCKGYYSDWLHVRDLMANWIIEQVYDSKIFGTNRPYMNSNDFAATDVNILAESGAKCHIDGIPCELYINDSYWGLYSLNIKKERKNYLLDKNDVNHIQVEAAENTTYTTGNCDWTKLEFRNPKSLIDMQGVAYDGENPKELIDSTSQYYDANNSKHVKTASVKASWNTFIANLTSISNSTTKSELESFMNIDAWVDYIVISWFISHWDNWCKNTLYTTWDGVHWSPLLYDMDNCFGITEITGDEEDPTNYDTFGYKAYTYCPWLRKVETILAQEIEERYAEYRRLNIFSAKNISELMQNWTKRIGRDVFERDVYTVTNTKGRWNYPGIGNTNKNFIDSIQRRVQWMQGRIEYLDNKYHFNNN